MPRATTSPAKTRARGRYLERTYGITLEQYDALLASNLGGCWICGRIPTKRKLHVEHDHKTGRVRGLACWRCNMMLQQAHDDPAILRYAAEYLESTEADDVLRKGTDA